MKSNKLTKKKPDVNSSLLAAVLKAAFRNNIRSTAHTKTRSEKRGGGRKPWRQKGTGRARHGSLRSPIWKGGGVAFGPKSGAFSCLKINRKNKAQIAEQIFNFFRKNKKMVELSSIPNFSKTSQAKKWLSQYLKPHENCVIISRKATQNLGLRNLSNVTLMNESSLRYEKIIFANKIIYCPKKDTKASNSSQSNKK